MARRVRGLEEIQAALIAKVGKLTERVGAGLAVEGVELARVATSKVPVVTGKLRAAVRIRTFKEAGATRVAIYYDVPYAPKVHEESTPWLGDAASEQAVGMPARVAAKAKVDR